MPINNASITRIKAVYNALEELQDKVVFIGGATVSLYADRVIIEPRPTDDVDVIVEILNYKERIQLEEKLRSKGFTHDIESGIVCRYKIQGIAVDVIPTDDSSMGFNTRWYEDGFHTSVPYRIDDQHIIRILSTPHFIATKLEAFNDRGGGEGRTSQDFEDIVFILENRSNIWNEVKASDGELKKYLVEEFSRLKSNKNLFEWIDGHVERNEVRATRKILESMNSWIDFETQKNS